MGAVSFSLDERMLGFFARTLPLQVFLETGTFEGESLRLACDVFDECHSVELSPQLYEAASRQFAGRAGVHLHLGKSPEILRAHRDRLASVPVFFWLDAHWCAAEQTAGAESQSPLMAELEAIGKLHPQSVVLIDDARLYLCPPPAPHRFADWPDFHAILTGLQALSPNHRLMVLNDVILFYPEIMQLEMSLFAHKHGVDWLVIANDSRRFGPKRRRGPGFVRRTRNRLLLALGLRKK